MTREECANRIKDLAIEIRGTVLEYNQRNDYLRVKVCNGITYVYFSNPWREEGCEDRECPMELFWNISEEEENES